MTRDELTEMRDVAADNEDWRLVECIDGKLAKIDKGGSNED